MVIIKNMTRGTMFPGTYNLTPGENQITKEKYDVLSKEKEFISYKEAGLVKAFAKTASTPETPKVAVTETKAKAKAKAKTTEKE